MILTGIMTIGAASYFAGKSFKKWCFQKPQPSQQLSCKVVAKKSITSSGDVIKDDEVARIEQGINRTLATSSSIVLLRVVGNFGYPLLIVLSVPAIIYMAGFFTFKAYVTLRKEGKIGVDFTDAVCWILMPLLGYSTLAAMYSSLVLISQKIFLKTRDNSKKELASMFEQTPRSVWIRQGSVETQILFEALNVGDIVVIQAGEAVPADGRVTEGFATVDQHILTGEAQPVEKDFGSTVLASTIVLSGKIYVTVSPAIICQKIIPEKTTAYRVFNKPGFVKSKSSGQNYLT